jgi:hypothetical protein
MGKGRNNMLRYRIGLLLVPVLIVSLAESVVTAEPLVINEFMASNSNNQTDPQGQYDDWIEIYNYGSDFLDIGRMYLSDDTSDPTKWQIPAGTTIAAGGYLLIWADNDTSDAGLHANFKLNSDGEEIGLFDTDGVTLIDMVAYPAQTADISYGRYPDGSDTWQFMATPTPGGRNNSGYIGVVVDPEFSHTRGFYDTPFSVSITTETEGATVFYTLDDSSPFDSETGIPTGSIYTHPIPISTTTCLRAIAFKNSWEPSSIITDTYIFLDDVIQQATDPVTGSQVTPTGYPDKWPGGSYSGTVTGDYQMDPDVVGQNGRDKFGGLYAGTIKDDLKSVPTISLVMNKDDWFGPTGIYINESQDGSERVCSLEWIDPNGEGGFQVNCAMAVQGGISGGGTSLDRWKTFKISMRPRFKTTTDDGKSTGGPSQLDYRIFPDSPIEHFDTFVIDEVLSNAWNHSGQHYWPTYIQDQYVSDLHNAMGGQSPHGLYAHLYINGLYWGMYYIHERPDDAWAAQMFGGKKEEYDVLKHHTNMVVNDGLGGSAIANFNAMLSTANAVAADPTNQAKYDALCRMLDIDNFITDLLTHWFAVNWDWPDKNWYATHRNSPDGRWRFHTWDAEHSLEYWDSSNVLGQSVSDLHNKLKANAEYRMHFADLVHKFFFNNGVLTYPNTADMLRARMAQIDRAIVGESARWGDTRSSMPGTRADWLEIQNNILSQFIEPRSTFVLNWLINAGLYPNVEAPVFQINGSYQHGGQADTNSSFSMTNTTGAIYYSLDGTDPRLPGSSGDSISTTLVAENAAKRVFVPTGSVNDNWKGGGAFNDSTWISGTGGVGYERSSGYEQFIDIDLESQMYQGRTSCYIRIPFTVENADGLNSMTLKVRYDDGFLAYLNGVEVARRNFTGTPAWNSSADTTHSDAEAVNFEYIDISSYLNTLNSGDNILAIHGLNESITSSDFLISVELVAVRDNSSQNSDVDVPTGVRQYTSPITLTESAHIKARVLSGSTWSALNEATYAVGPVVENLRITEIMYHPQSLTEPNDPNEEFIELTNIGSETINLNLVKFTNGIDFTFSGLELDPGEYVVVVQDFVAFEARYGTGINIAGQYTGKLANNGERIRLEDAVGQTILDFSYKDGWYDGTDGQGFSLTIIDPTNPDPGGWNEKDSWRASVSIGGSPGWDDSNQ